MVLSNFSITLGVVPIFVNAGAALLPAILAGLTSVLALLANPRALLRLLVKRPLTSLAVVGVTLAVCLGIPAFLTATASHARQPVRTDWAAKARAILALQATTQNGQSLLTHLWHHDFGNSTALLATPCIDGKRIIVPTTTLDIVSKFGTLYALDLATGNTLWTTDRLDDSQDLKPFFSSPAVTPDGSRLVIGQGLHDDADCPLLCVDVASGKILWSLPTPLHVESSPVILNCGGSDLAIVGVGAIEGPDRKPTGAPPWNIGYVLCVDIATGQELWRHALADPESSPAAYRDTVIIGSGFNGNAIVQLHADPNDVPLPSTAPALSTQSARPSAPREIQRRQLPFPGVGNVTIAGDSALLGAGNSDYVFDDPNPAGLVACFDAATLNSRWQSSLPNSVLGPLTVHQQTVLAGCRNGELFALSLRDGTILWHSRISASTISTPVLAGAATDGRLVFALAADGTLAVLDLADGQVLQRMLLADESRSSRGITVATPIVRDGKLYVATETSGLHCFQIQPPSIAGVP